MKKEKQASFISQHPPYGLKGYLDSWTNISGILEYEISPGIAKENFFQDWDYDYLMYDPPKYFWQNQVIKKIPADAVFGCAPFVYGEALNTVFFNDDEKVDMVFLPRSDWSTFLDEDKKQEIIDALNEFEFDEDTYYITFPPDLAFWKQVIPKNLYKIAEAQYDDRWGEQLIRLMKKAKTVYCPMFCSTTLYATWCGAKTRFYDERKIHIKEPTLIEKDIHKHYSPQNKNEEWNRGMKYIQEIYSDDTLSDEKKYLTYQFFSLDLVEKPWDLYQKLRSLNERVEEIDYKIPEYNIRTDDCFYDLKDQIRKYECEPSKEIFEFFSKL